LDVKEWLVLFSHDLS